MTLGCGDRAQAAGIIPPRLARDHSTRDSEISPRKHAGGALDTRRAVCYAAGDLKATIVTFASTSVDNGNPYVVGVPCTAGSSVSPTSQAWSTTDSGGFECDFTCAAATGPSLTISYQ
jgi:hypothetical protein